MFLNLCPNCKNSAIDWSLIDVSYLGLNPFTSSYFCKCSNCKHQYVVYKAEPYTNDIFFIARVQFNKNKNPLFYKTKLGVKEINEFCKGKVIIDDAMIDIPAQVRLLYPSELAGDTITISGDLMEIEYP